MVESARYNHAENLSFMNLTRSPPAVVVVPSGRTPRASSLRADLLRARARAGPYLRHHIAYVPGAFPLISWRGFVATIAVFQRQVQNRHMGGVGGRERGALSRRIC